MDLSRTCSTNGKLEDLQEMRVRSTDTFELELEQGNNKSGPWLKPQQH
jgi:hypothetical protein